MQSVPLQLEVKWSEHDTALATKARAFKRAGGQSQLNLLLDVFDLWMLRPSNFARSSLTNKLWAYIANTCMNDDSHGAVKHIDSSKVCLEKNDWGWSRSDSNTCSLNMRAANFCNQTTVGINVFQCSQSPTHVSTGQITASRKPMRNTVQSWAPERARVVCAHLSGEIMQIPRLSSTNMDKQTHLRSHKRRLQCVWLPHGSLKASLGHTELK